MGDLKVRNFAGAETSAQYDKVPNSCPYCHNKITPRITGGNVNKYGLELVFVCANSDCQRTFIGIYLQGQHYYLLNSVSIGNHKPRTFSDNITSISEKFSEIYNQALTSEYYHLDHIAGIGYRKALEFLIKDYLIHRLPNKEEEIKKNFLGKCIKDDVQNQNLKDIAERATWLGNDETHYVRKWEDKDVQDLKILIDVAVHWIEMEMLTEKYKAEMN